MQKPDGTELETGHAQRMAQWSAFTRSSRTLFVNRRFYVRLPFVYKSAAPGAGRLLSFTTLGGDRHRGQRRPPQAREAGGWWFLMGSVQQVPCMVMESVHGVMRRVAGLARAHARARCARRGDFRTPRGGASSRCGNALRMRRPAGERQCGSLIEPD